MDDAHVDDAHVDDAPMDDAQADHASVDDASAGRPSRESLTEGSDRDIVRNTLLEYARRGVFRGFDVKESGAGTSFRFVWLWERPLHLTYDDRDASLTFHGLLPGVGPESDVRSDLERLLHDRMEGKLPPHRSVDPERATVELVNEEGQELGLALRVRGAHHEYGVRKLLNLVNEIWVRLNDRHQRYLWEQLGAPME